MPTAGSLPSPDDGPCPDRGSLTDSELVERTRRGDARAYAELWRRHRSAALGAARRITLRFDAEDLVAESFARVLKAILAGGGPNTAFRTYLTTTIRNVATNWAKAQPVIASLESVPEVSDGVDHTLRTARLDSLSRAFETLPERWRIALWYSVIEGLSHAEMALLLDIAPSAVAMLTMRARRGLLRALREQGPETLRDF
jgi:RNA polymerase sigma factor (sigma-70 family)